VARQATAKGFAAVFRWWNVLEAQKFPPHTAKRFYK